MYCTASAVPIVRLSVLFSPIRISRVACAWKFAAAVLDGRSVGPMRLRRVYASYRALHPQARQRYSPLLRSPYLRSAFARRLPREARLFSSTAVHVRMRLSWDTCRHVHSVTSKMLAITLDALMCMSSPATRVDGIYEPLGTPHRGHESKLDITHACSPSGHPHGSKRSLAVLRTRLAARKLSPRYRAGLLHPFTASLYYLPSCQSYTAFRTMRNEVNVPHAYRSSCTRRREARHACVSHSPHCGTHRRHPDYGLVTHQHIPSAHPRSCMTHSGLPLEGPYLPLASSCIAHQTLQILHDPSMHDICCDRVHIRNYLPSHLHLHHSRDLLRVPRGSGRAAFLAISRGVFNSAE